MKNLARALHHCWKVYKKASCDYFAPLLVLWEGSVGGKVNENESQRTRHIGKA